MAVDTLSFVIREITEVRRQLMRGKEEEYTNKKEDEQGDRGREKRVGGREEADGE